MVIVESVCDCGGRGGVEASSARGFHLRERKKECDRVSEKKKSVLWV